MICRNNHYIETVQRATINKLAMQKSLDTHGGFVTPSLNPNCRQATFASRSVHWLSHTCPFSPSYSIIKKPELRTFFRLLSTSLIFMAGNDQNRRYLFQNHSNSISVLLCELQEDLGTHSPYVNIKLWS